MVNDTEDQAAFAGRRPDPLRRITPDELDEVITQARDEKWTDLVLLGHQVWTDRSPPKWPQAFRGRMVFRLTARSAGLPSLLQGLSHLRSLVLWKLDLDASAAVEIVSNLKQLTSLTLRGNRVEDAGARGIASGLRQLTLLDLGGNGVGAEGAKAIASNLKQLTSLTLRNNQLGDDGARAIASNLGQLTSLDLGWNRVGAEGAKVIASNLKQLNSLDLAGNRVSAEGAKVIASNLKQLNSLDLGWNGVGAEGAKAIAGNLRQLTSLDLGRNDVGAEGTRAIASNLRQLTSLDLGKNRVGDEGVRVIASNLKQLTSLDLGGNRVGDDGATVIASSLNRLTSLDLGGNRVGAEGTKAIVSSLRQLTSLDLSGNLLGDEEAGAAGEGLPCLIWLNLAMNASIRSVAWSRVPSGLRSLNLANTGVSDLSPLKGLVQGGLPLQWDDDTYSDGIHVKDCPLVHPTPEIVQQGHEAVLNYFREIERQGVDHLYEAKVLLVGEGGAGKTSLLGRLYNPEQPLPAEDKSTRGIDVHVRHFDRPGGGTFRLNVWDFGGQQIYHATHQFFLTKSSLYVLVDDTRKDHKSVHDEGFKYWLEVVEAFGDKSPILIFQNEKGGRSKAIDEAGIKGRFPNVLQTLRGDLDRTDAAEGMRQAIEQVVQRLPHVGQEVPAKWVTIRAEIEEAAKQRPTISLDEYLRIYDKHLERDRDKALLLSRYLHDIGVFLHFQDDLRLRKTVIVQNHWATEAVFRVLDDEQVKARVGYFDRTDCARLWADSEYADMHMELLALMERFELCYQLPGNERWLAPQLLSPSTPEYVKDWAKPSDLVLTYRYDFLPRGLVSRLMVRAHRFVANPEKSWSSGAFFEQEGTALLALTESTGDAITLRARGPEKKALLSVIASTLDDLNASFQGLADKIHKKVPCICDKCRQKALPEQFDEQRLLQRRRDGKATIECPSSYVDVSVLELLDGVKVEHLPKWADPPPAGRKIRIFVASSEELRADRDEFELYFRRQNDRLLKDGLYLEIVRWENFLDAMSETRLQDEYNRKVRACDIFVALFMTKTGKFTDEEFDVAHAQFQKASKPLIYTFFKKATIPATSEAHANLGTLLTFQEKLKRLGHFWTRYESAEDLKLQFKDQLEKLEETNFEGHRPASGG